MRTRLETCNKNKALLKYTFDKVTNPIPVMTGFLKEEPLEPDDPDEPGPSKPKKPRKSSEKTKKKKKTDKKKKAEPKKKEKKRKSDSTEHVVDCDRLLEYFAPLQLVTHCRLVQVGEYILFFVVGIVFFSFSIPRNI